MVCLAITAQGWGSILRFNTEREAFLHPVVQYGDAIIPEAASIPDLYATFEWLKLMDFAGVRDTFVCDTLPFLCQREARQLRVKVAPKVWDGLVAKAVDPPATLPEIIAMVARDRTITEKKEMAIKTAGEKAEKEPKVKTPKEPKVKTPKAPKEPKAEVVRAPADMNASATIQFGVDKEGNAYHPTENSPYRPDSNRAQRFQLITPGITVGEALQAGLAARQLRNMHDSGHIVISGFAAAQPAVDESDSDAE